jgi:predicted DNA-binding transcriptional regulator AlpA
LLQIGQAAATNFPKIAPLFGLLLGGAANRVILPHERARHVAAVTEESASGADSMLDQEPAPAAIGVLNYTQAARSANVSVVTFRSWTRLPGFPRPRRIGKKPYFLAAEIREWLLSQEEVAHA